MFRVLLKKKTIFYCLLALTLGYGLLPDNLTVVQAAAGSAQKAGDIVSCQEFTTYDRERLAQILSEDGKELNISGQSQFPAPGNEVKLYRLQYLTVNPAGEGTITASGLLALPAGTESAPIPVLLYQHDSVFAIKSVPSQPEASPEARLVLAVFAAQGYAVFMPDYLGKGSGEKIIHPYLLAASEASAARDMLLAGKKFCAKSSISLADSIFLSGWGQGGHGTMALLHLIETEKTLSVKGAAAIAAPYDLYMTWQSWQNRKHAPEVPVMMAYLLNSYEKYAAINGLTTAALNPLGAKAAQEVFTRDLPKDSLFASFPAAAPDLLRRDFAQAGQLGETAFYKALRNNEVYAWRVATPLRMYYSMGDDIVPSEVAVMTYYYLRGLDCSDVALVNAGTGGHADTFVFALNHAKKWFDELRK